MASTVPDARDVFAKCIDTMITKYKAVPGLTPAGIAYFVGIACASSRQGYYDALSANGYDADYVLRQTDATAAIMIMRNTSSPAAK